MRLVDYCANISMETILMNMENSKTNESHILVLNLMQKLDLTGFDNCRTSLTYVRLLLLAYT